MFCYETNGFAEFLERFCDVFRGFVSYRCLILLFPFIFTVVKVTIDSIATFTTSGAGMFGEIFISSNSSNNSLNTWNKCHKGKR